MIELAIDVETTGFPSSSKPLDHEDQPHIMQIGMVMRENGDIVGEYSSHVVCPVDPQEGAFKVHGISRQKTIDLGVPPNVIMHVVISLAMKVDRIIAHNVSFDMKILEIAARRCDMTLPNSAMQFCTMKEWARLKGGKWPKLEDAWEQVDQEGFPDDVPMHDAYWDARKALAIYDHLIENNDDDLGDELPF